MARPARSYLQLEREYIVLNRYTKVVTAYLNRLVSKSEARPKRWVCIGVDT